MYKLFIIFLFSTVLALPQSLSTDRIRYTPPVNLTAPSNHIGIITNGKVVFDFTDVGSGFFINRVYNSGVKLGEGGWYLGADSASTIYKISVSNFITIIPAFNITSAGVVQVLKAGTLSNCTSTANPAVCSSASSGGVIIAAAATSVVINTTAVSNQSQIVLTRNSLDTKLAVTCNTQSSLVLGTPRETARVQNESFTITIDVAPTTNPLCISYQIIN